MGIFCLDLLQGEEGRHYLHHWTEILGSGGHQEALSHQTKNVQLFNPKKLPTKEILYFGACLNAATVGKNHH